MKKSSYVILMIICLIPSATTFSREYSGYYFRTIDLDDDCQNSRMEILNKHNLSGESSECSIHSGYWYLPYTDRIETNPKMIYIDHIVPIKWAWVNGIHALKQYEILQFANDELNMIVSHRSVKLDKDDKGIDEWLPQNEEYICTYIIRFMSVVYKYKLNYPDEYESILTSCK